jgi:hypothetical protein
MFPRGRSLNLHGRTNCHKRFAHPINRWKSKPLAIACGKDKGACPRLWGKPSSPKVIPLSKDNRGEYYKAYRPERRALRSLLWSKVNLDSRREYRAIRYAYYVALPHLVRSLWLLSDRIWLNEIETLLYTYLSVWSTKLNGTTPTRWWWIVAFMDQKLPSIDGCQQSSIEPA